MRKDEKRNAMKKTHRSDKKKTVRIVLTVFMCVCALFTLFIFIRSFLPVTRFELSGVTQYDKAEIIGYSGIKKGDRLYSIDLKETEKTLLENCAYIEEVEVEREFPNKIVFRIIEKTPHWYVDIAGDYYSIDSNFYVIEESKTKDKFVNLNVPQLILPNLRQLICGELPDFGADETEIKKVLELVFAVQSTNFKTRITLVDIESRFDVNIVVDGKYKVYMGDISNISEKLLAVEKILKSGDLEDFAGAEIDASMPETITVDPIYESQ